MKHEVKIVEEDSDLVTQSFGIDNDAYEAMVDNITLELFHTYLFSGDNRSVSKCLLDALDNLDPQDFGLEPKNANDYMVIGLALGRSIELMDCIKDGFRAKAESKHPSLSDMTSFLQKLTRKAEQQASPIETKGSLN